MSRPIPRKYKTTNWQSYNAALKKRGSLTIWFDPGMDWRASLTGKPGRQPTFSAAVIQTCLTLKVLFRLPLRQVIGLVESLVKLANLDWPVPDFSALSARVLPKTARTTSDAGPPIPIPSGLGQDVFPAASCAGFLVHLHSLTVTMNQKSSVS